MPLPGLVALDTPRLALLLLAVEPRLRGIAFAGPAGSGKSALLHGLAALLPDLPFEMLPLGSDEEALLGGLDLEATLARGARVVRHGLLARADGGLLAADPAGPRAAEHVLLHLGERALEGLLFLGAGEVGERFVAELGQLHGLRSSGRWCGQDGDPCANTQRPAGVAPAGRCRDQGNRARGSLRALAPRRGQEACQRWRCTRSPKALPVSRRNIVTVLPQSTQKLWLTLIRNRTSRSQAPHHFVSS